ncbi:MAG: SRPBCC family protein [Acidimicrobiales bacterium]
MTTHSVTHTTFVIDRIYPVPPARVFSAFADCELKERWFAMPDDWVDKHHSLDFRVGGHETNRGGPEGGPVHRFEARYQDIVDNQRIVYTYDLYLDDRRMSVSLATVEFALDAEGTRMTFTEQGAFLDGIGDSADREHGTNVMADALGKMLSAMA